MGRGGRARVAPAAIYCVGRARVAPAHPSWPFIAWAANPRPGVAAPANKRAFHSRPEQVALAICPRSKIARSADGVSSRTRGIGHRGKEVARHGLDTTD